MDNVNYIGVKIHQNGLEVLKPSNTNCRITLVNKLSTRGRITGFSARSANRLRRLLLDIDFGSAWAICLTLPSIKDAERVDFSALWHGFVVYHKSRSSAPFIWRVELQQRKVPHWHCVFCGDYQSALGFKYLWHDYVSRRLVCSLPFFLHSVKIQQVFSGSSALMYLTAHMSKHKSSQLGWLGRQWGVVNRASLSLLPAGSTLEVSDYVWRLIVRQFRRLTVRLCKDNVYTGAFGRSCFRRMIFGKDEWRFWKIWNYYTTVFGSFSVAEKKSEKPH